MSQSSSPLVRVACVQMRPDVGQVPANVARSLELCTEAVADGADLIVLPELCSSGYAFRDRAEAWECAEEIPHGPAVAAWSEFCAANRVHLVAGIAERLADGSLFNSSVVLGPEGHIGTFRKVHLWDRETLIFDRGDLGFPVFPTPLGRIATFICYDGWFPECYRSVAEQGADIVCMPTNWVPIPGQDPAEPAMATVLARANAHSNSVYVAAADRIGTERDQPFVGQSVIVSHTGAVLAGPASVDREELLAADLDLSAAGAHRRIGPHNDLLTDRRPESYGTPVVRD